jgi:hypothetical protein
MATKTINRTGAVQYNYTAVAAPSANWYTNLIEKAEAVRFPLMVMLLLAGTCMGSVAIAYLGFDAAAWEMALVLMPVVMANSFMLAQASMKAIIPVFVVSMIVNIVVTVVNI